MPRKRSQKKESEDLAVIDLKDEILPPLITQKSNIILRSKSINVNAPKIAAPANSQTSAKKNTPKALGDLNPIVVLERIDAKTLQVLSKSNEKENSCLNMHGSRPPFLAPDNLRFSIIDEGSPTTSQRLFDEVSQFKRKKFLSL